MRVRDRKLETPCLSATWFPRNKTQCSSSFQDFHDGCTRLVRSIVPPPICRLLFPFTFSLTEYNIYIGNALSTRREIQAVLSPLPPPPLPSPSPSSSAQPISVTMGWFPERSGVDAKLSGGSLFDLLLPIYKYESASGKKRACVRECMLGRRGARTL